MKFLELYLTLMVRQAAPYNFCDILQEERGVGLPPDMMHWIRREGHGPPYRPETCKNLRS
jgi:hypothetical protein